MDVMYRIFINTHAVSLCKRPTDYKLGMSKGLFIWARSTGLARFLRSRLATLFFVKITMSSYERQGWPGYRDLGFCIRVTTIAAKMAKFWSCMCFHYRSVRISFISKVTRVHKAMTVANNTSLCSTILMVFLEFIPVDRAEVSHMNIPQNSSR